MFVFPKDRKNQDCEKVIISNNFLEVIIVFWFFQTVGNFFAFVRKFNKNEFSQLSWKNDEIQEFKNIVTKKPK